MSIFRWRKKPVGDYPFGMSADDIMKLRDLRSQPGFATFVQLLRDIAEYNGDALLESYTDEQLHDRKGYCRALRDTVTLIDRTLKHAEVVEHERRTKEESRSAGLNLGAFLGSPWWDRVLDRDTQN